MVKLPPVNRMLPVLLALTVAIIWTYLTRSMYNYNIGFGEILTLSAFPLIGWTIALTIGYFFISNLLAKIPADSIPLQTLIALIFYSVAVIIAETVGYHIFGVHNIGTSQYTGLPLCDCLHAPLWMQAGYFLLGPLHWLIVRIAQDYLWPLLKRGLVFLR